MRGLKKHFVTLCFIFLILIIAAGCSMPGGKDRTKKVTISNTIARRDTFGNIIDAHDGCLEKFRDRFYLYGTAYGGTNGFTRANHYVCYSSPDLMNWTFHGAIMKNLPEEVCFCYRPYVKYNKKTGKYVLWYNWYSEGFETGRLGVAVSDRPQGPFVTQNAEVELKYYPLSIGDHGLFVDDDGTGYVAYTLISATDSSIRHSISVEKLTDDYLGSTKESSGFVAGNCESPAMFKRDGVYYLLFDNTCAFCATGSGARVYTAPSPLGPFTYKGNINRKGGFDQPTDMTKPGTGRADSTIAAQQTHIAAITTAGGTTYHWIGDLWGSRPDKTKGHDFQYWSEPLEFDANGMIKPLQWQEQWSVELPAP